MTGLDFGLRRVTLSNDMKLTYVNLKGTVAAIMLFACFGTGVTAQQADLTDENELLAALAESDPIEARRLDRQLQALWSKSGSPSMDLLLKRGRDAMEVDDMRAAMDHLTALTDHAPEFAEGWHARASAFFEAELYGLALDDLSRALALNPNNYNAIFGLGAILETFNDPERAYDAYERAQAIHPHHEQVTKALERLRPHVEGKAL